MSFYDYIKTTFEKNKILFRNFSSLSLLQISQYILPLITFPYLVRVLGPDGYGLVSFAMAFVGYFTVLTDYGFNLSATKEISINRENNYRICEIFNSVMMVKIILFLLSIIIIIPVVLVFSKFARNYEIYFISFISVFGTVLFPVWFFQGVERMGFISAITIGIKIIWVAMVFLFVKAYDDIIILVSLNAGSAVLIGIIGLIAVKQNFKINFYLPEKIQIKKQFIDSWHYFLSNLSISLYTISNVFILGLFANNTIVGYFSAADRIRSAVQNITSIAGQTVFPHLSFEFKRSKKIALNFIKKYIKTVGSFSIIMSVVLFIFADEIVLLVLGPNYMHSIPVLMIISVLPFIIFLSNVAGIQTMLNLGYKKDFANIIIIAGIFNLILSFVIVPIYFEIGTAVSVLLTEILVTSMMIIFLFNKNINIFVKVEPTT